MTGIDRKVKKTFLRITRNLFNWFWWSFFKMTGTIRSTKQKKDHWNRITRSQDNFFYLWIESESNSDQIVKILIWSNPFRTLMFLIIKFYKHIKYGYWNRNLLKLFSFRYIRNIVLGVCLFFPKPKTRFQNQNMPEIIISFHY